MIRTAGEGLHRAWVTLNTIRARLTLWYVVLLALTLVGFSAFLLLSLSHNLYAALDESLRTASRQIVEDLDSRRGVPRLGGEFPPGVLVALYDAEGDELLGTNTSSLFPQDARARAQAARGDQVFSTAILPENEQWRVMSTRALTDEGVPAVLQISRPEREVRAALGQLSMLMAIAIPLILLLAVVGGLFMAGRALGPVDRITRAAQSIGAEDLSKRLNLPPAPDEVGRLATTFDQMLDRLDRAFRRQQQFTADASHELRTPLAVLRSEADVALERPRTAAEYQQALANIRSDAARMARLLSGLLTLARADGGREALTMEPLALDVLAEEVVASMAPLAQTRSVHLERSSTDWQPAMVSGDQTRLMELTVNLIDNGLKYTPEGGTVTVSVGQERDEAVLRVSDTGIGIASKDLPHLFERFYRVDQARARSDGGFGLGLALSQWIVETHGGSITVASQPGAGSTFTVRLPLLRERRRASRPSRRHSLVSASQPG
jgi:heavy metal sensor kinase